MPRIPELEIERLKTKVSVERLVEASGIELKKSGKDWLGRCPFHEDDTASLVVTPAKNLWHCFGCGVGGGPIDWVIKRQGVSFRHAVELLREGVTPLAAEGSVKRSTVRVLPPPVAFDADDQALLNQTVGYYHERLLATTEAAEYLAARGLVHPELIGYFKLGVADRTLGLRLPEKNRKAGADIRAQLQKIGLIRDSGHEHFNGSLVVPVFDEAGNVVEVYGRKLLDNLRAGTPKHLYLPAREVDGQRHSRGVFNVAALQAGKEIILCEALIDALTFWCAGYRNVTAVYGIEGFTEEHIAAFKHHGTERVLIAYDRDDAGERGAAKVAECLMAQGIECFRVQFPKGTRGCSSRRLDGQCGRLRRPHRHGRCCGCHRLDPRRPSHRPKSPRPAMRCKPQSRLAPHSSSVLKRSASRPSRLRGAAKAAALTRSPPEPRPRPEEQPNSRRLKGSSPDLASSSLLAAEPCLRACAQARMRL